MFNKFRFNRLIKKPFKNWSKKDWKFFDKHKDVFIKPHQEDFSDINIDWEVHEMFDSAGDGHCFYHFADGTDLNGHKYEGDAVLVDDVIVEIENIKRV